MAREEGWGPIRVRYDWSPAEPAPAILRDRRNPSHASSSVSTTSVCGKRVRRAGPARPTEARLIRTQPAISNQRACRAGPTGPLSRPSFGPARCAGQPCPQAVPWRPGPSLASICPESGLIRVRPCPSQCASTPPTSPLGGPHAIRSDACRRPARPRSPSSPLRATCAQRTSRPRSPSSPLRATCAQRALPDARIDGRELS